ncbi:DM9 repeat-containing protein [Pseudobacteriovorax antillogorgiicola]|uniref:DM9 repeat-containing protein n=1 Tax=Pseudobacteriovorax antillogorgiicola TaxID=1513793 RepID=UPI0013563ACA|nr:DM9 repeat-containing protein [Pseudobacteriovorax antillogorgiicola]
MIRLFSVSVLGILGCNNSSLVDAVQTGKTSEAQDDDVREREDEAVSTPVNVSGAYLYCQVNQPAIADDPGIIGCAIQDIESNEKLDLGEWNDDIVWQPQVNDSQIRIETQTQKQSSAWHALHLIQGESADQVNEAMAKIWFKAAVPGRIPLESNQAGPQEAVEFVEEAATMVDQVLEWQALTGEAVPTNAVPGGSEHRGLVPFTVCRNYHSGGVIPGKLAPHHLDSSRSICRTALDGATFLSVNSQFELLYHYDVLVEKPEDEYQWISSSDGNVPEKAVITGRLADGTALYSCRNLEAGPPPVAEDRTNDPAGEQTPGYLADGATDCVHEYYGEKRSTSYEVLVKQ